MKTKHKFSGFQVSVHVIFIIMSLMCVIPLLLVLSISLTDEQTLMQEGYRLIPRQFSIAAYKYVLSGASSVVKAYGVTIFVTVVGTALHLLTTSMLAYCLSREEVKARGFWSLFVYIPVLFSGGMIPYYLMMVKVLNLKDTIAVLIIALLVSPVNVLIMKNFMKTIPVSLLESARIDGSGEIRTFFKIVFPLSKPSLASIGLFVAIGYWNDWYTCSLFIEDQNLQTLQFLLQSLMKNIQNLMAHMDQNQSIQQAAASLPSEGARMATCMLAVGPIIFLYPLLQKYFAKGLTIGAVKE